MSSGLVRKLWALLAGDTGAGPALPTGREPEAGSHANSAANRDVPHPPKSPIRLTGSVELVGLSDIKAELGAKWAVLGPRAAELARAEIGKRMGPADLYRQIDASCFQICFGEDGDREAKAKTAEICRAIRRAIFTELAELDGRVSIQGFVTRVPQEEVEDARDPIAAAYAAMLKIRRSQQERARASKIAPALLHAEVVFQPLWPVPDSSRTQNRCVLDPISGGAIADVFQSAELDDLTGALVTLDCVILSKAVQALHRAPRRPGGATILVPVHFQTLISDMQLELFSTADLMPEQYRRQVILDIITVPAAADPDDLSEAIESARLITDRVILQVSPTDHRLTADLLESLWGVSIDLTDADGQDPAVAQAITRFAEVATRHGVQSYAYGASTIRKALQPAESGFNYVGGSAVHGTVDTPRPPARFAPVFRRRTAGTSRLDQNASSRVHSRFVPRNPSSTLTLSDGRRYACRVVNASLSGALVLSKVSVEQHACVALGNIPAEVVRFSSEGFAVRFLEVQQSSLIETALQTRLQDPKVLQRPLLSGGAPIHQPPQDALDGHSLAAD